MMPYVRNGVKRCHQTAILPVMSQSLGAFVIERRVAVGYRTQRALADASGIKQPDLSDIERGATKLPNPETRRKLAKALRVTHLDLLIAAGEITENEIQDAGKEGTLPQPQFGAPPPDLDMLFHQVEWFEPRTSMIRDVLQGMVRMDNAANDRRDDEST